MLTLLAWPLRHWRGQTPLLWTLLVALGCGYLAIVAAVAALPQDHNAGLFIALCIAFMVWQIVGTARSIENQATGSGRGATMTLGYSALAAAIVLETVQLVGVGLGPAPPPPESRIVRPASNIELRDGALVLAGEITLQSVSRAIELLEQDAGITRFVLDSPGGSVPAARGLARLVLEGGLNTHVTGRCFSACPLVFMAGDLRTIEAGAEIGFHGYEVEGHQNLGAHKLLDKAEEEARDTGFYLSRGLDEAFVTRAFQTPHTELWKPDVATLGQAGVLRD